MYSQQFTVILFGLRDPAPFIGTNDGSLRGDHQFEIVATSSVAEREFGLVPFFYCAGRSEFHVSTTHFHSPLACFFQISSVLPVSVNGLPFASFVLIVYRPYAYAISPSADTSTLSVVQFSFSHGIPINPAISVRIASLVFAVLSLGGSTSASSL